MSNRKIIFIFFASAFTLLIGAAVLYRQNIKKQNQPDANTPSKEVQKKQDYLSTLPFSQINKTSFLQHSGVSSCEKKAGQEQADCFKKLELAMNSTSSIACDGLENEDDRLVCAKNTFIKQAISEGKIDKCNEFVNDADRIGCAGQVYFSLAIWRRDASFCKKIKSETDRNGCLAAIGSAAKK